MGDIDSLFGEELLSGLSGRIAAAAVTFSELSCFISSAASDPDRDRLNRVSDGKPSEADPPSYIE